MFVWVYYTFTIKNFHSVWNAARRIWEPWSILPVESTRVPKYDVLSVCNSCPAIVRPYVLCSMWPHRTSHEEEMTLLPRLVKTIGRTTKNQQKPKAPEPGLVKTIGKTKKQNQSFESTDAWSSLNHGSGSWWPKIFGFFCFFGFPYGFD